MEEQALLREKLRDLKIIREWNLTRFARIIGIEPSTLRRFLNGGAIHKGGRTEKLIISLLISQHDGEPFNDDDWENVVFKQQVGMQE